MNVVFKFLSEEPADNIATCLNFRPDKVVFFGKRRPDTEKKKNLRIFVKNVCGISDAEMITVSESSMDRMLGTIKDALKKETEEGMSVIFDITGGDVSFAVALGMISEQYDLPIFYWDMEKNKPVIQRGKGLRSLNEILPKQNIKITVADFISLRGGKINYGLHKSSKMLEGDESLEDLEKICEISGRFNMYWNYFSDFMKNLLKPEEGLYGERTEGYILKCMNAKNCRFKRIDVFKQIMDALYEKGLLTVYEIQNGLYRFKVKNKQIKEWIWDAGSVLELCTFLSEKKKSDDCLVGVHLDWDGVIHTKSGEDVLNEVDVLSIKGCVPRFISCKSGFADKNALYELDSVAKKFGGKYAEKILAVSRNVSKTTKNRAEEMNIKIVRF